MTIFEGMASKIDDRTKAVFCETVGNPSGNVVDVERMAEIAHAGGVPLIVDNTVPTPYLWRPIEQGADIVIHSLTKYMGGHGTTVAGAMVDSGKFPWAEHKERFAMLNEPDPSYHGVVYTEALGPAAFIGRCRVVPLRNTGSALSPFNAFQILQGIETLPLRMDRHCENAQKVAEYLEGHEQVTWVKFAGLPDSPDHALAQKYMNGRAASILSFGIKGGAEAGAKFIDALQLITRLVNIGDAKSLACHPATTTHRQLNDAELESAGVTRDMVRLSIGIEHVDDILADIEQALAVHYRRPDRGAGFPRPATGLGSDRIPGRCGERLRPAGGQDGRLHRPARCGREPAPGGVGHGPRNRPCAGRPRQRTHVHGLRHHGRAADRTAHRRGRFPAAGTDPGLAGARRSGGDLAPLQPDA
jgi:O-acetylhomoserine/O-acetylserine sulfhydrylase-like pyridoxal-dependent enzyme